MQIMAEYQMPVLRLSVLFRHLIGLPGRGPVVCTVFGLVVPPEVCQKPIDVKGWEPLAKPQPVVVIHGVVQAEIKRSGLLKRLFCKKYRRLGNKVFGQQTAQRVSPALVIFIAGNPPADLTIPGINVSTVAKAPVKAYQSLSSCTVQKPRTGPHSHRCHPSSTMPGYPRKPRQSPC